MAGTVLLLLKNWWKEILLALVIIAGILYVVNLQNTVEKQTLEITKLNMANTLLKHNNEKLTATVTANNKTISLLSKGAAATKREFDKLNLQVEHHTSVLTKRLKDIMAQETPATCEDTIKYLIEAVPSFKN